MKFTILTARLEDVTAYPIWPGAAAPTLPAPDYGYLLPAAVCRIQDPAPLPHLAVDPRILTPIESLCEHAAMQNGQYIRPQTIKMRAVSAYHWMSDGSHAAMMKSKGEQLAGHAFVQGLSSQYSHLSSSACSWCLVMREALFLPFWSMEHLN
jgi:hypothetical protein